jgi:hypothetical protein
VGHHQVETRISEKFIYYNVDIKNILKRDLVPPFFIRHIVPLKMDLTEGSETSAKLNLTPWRHPKEHVQVEKYFQY